MIISEQMSPRQGAQREAEAWRDGAGELVAWTMDRLVNRSDAYGAYTPPAVRGKPGREGKPIPTSYTAKRPLSAAVLLRHFRGERPEHSVGLHSTSLGNTCRCAAFDVDRHNDETDPALTWDRATRLYREAQARGFRPLLTDSNGNGGYHVRVIFDRPAASRDVHHHLRTIAAAANFRGEFFPKQAALSDRTRYGNWLRLPGRHHTRDHWARAWGGGRWLFGADAVAWLLGFAGDDAALVPIAPAERPGRTKRAWAADAKPGRMSVKDRVAKYLARCPNLASGEGRSRVAFLAASFLVRDVAQPDHEALAWLEAWDDANSPPLGRDRLAQVIADAHSYGRNAYGCGLKGGAW